MRKDVSLGKDEAQLISGCAILMMVIHHFFGFKEFLVNGNSYTSLFSVGGIEIERILAAFGKLCVAILHFVQDMPYVLYLHNILHGIGSLKGSASFSKPIGLSASFLLFSAYAWDCGCLQLRTSD